MSAADVSEETMIFCCCPPAHPPRRNLSSRFARKAPRTMLPCAVPSFRSLLQQGGTVEVAGAVCRGRQQAACGRRYRAARWQRRYRGGSGEMRQQAHRYGRQKGTAACAPAGRRGPMNVIAGTSSSFKKADIRPSAEATSRAPYCERRSAAPVRLPVP